MCQRTCCSWVKEGCILFDTMSIPFNWPAVDPYANLLPYFTPSELAIVEALPLVAAGAHVIQNFIQGFVQSLACICTGDVLRSVHAQNATAHCFAAVNGAAIAQYWHLIGSMCHARHAWMPHVAL